MRAHRVRSFDESCWEYHPGAVLVILSSDNIRQRPPNSAGRVTDGPAAGTDHARRPNDDTHGIADHLVEDSDLCRTQV
jgi:hypothetical protein